MHFCALSILAFLFLFLFFFNQYKRLVLVVGFDSVCFSSSVTSQVGLGFCLFCKFYSYSQLVRLTANIHNDQSIKRYHVHKGDPGHFTSTDHHLSFHNATNHED